MFKFTAPVVKFTAKFNQFQRSYSDLRLSFVQISSKSALIVLAGEPVGRVVEHDANSFSFEGVGGATVGRGNLSVAKSVFVSLVCDGCDLEEALEEALNFHEIFGIASGVNR